MGRVLVIGEDRMLADALRASADLRDHSVESCRTAIDAIRTVRTHAIDVVITDPATPLSLDLALNEELRSLRPGVRTIVLAPALTDEEVVRAMRAHVYACFAAPVNHSEVADLAAAAIETPEGRDFIEIVSGLPNWLTVRVSSALVTADRLTRFMTEWRPDGIDGDDDLLMTAFREMLLNAMEHGAGFDAEKVVEVTAARTARAIVFHFRDPGNGFDRTDLQHAASSGRPEDVQATLEQRIDKGMRPGGFGMLIVRQVADELVYNERGNEVLLVKYLDKD